MLTIELGSHAPPPFTALMLLLSTTVDHFIQDQYLYMLLQMPDN